MCLSTYIYRERGGRFGHTQTLGTQQTCRLYIYIYIHTRVHVNRKLYIMCICVYVCVSIHSVYGSIVCIYIYTHANTLLYIYIKLKIGPMFALFEVNNWSNFCFFIYEILILPAERRGFLKKKTSKNNKNTRFEVKNWSNYVAQHAWTSF